MGNKLFSTTDGKSPLKGLKARDRKEWDKTAKNTLYGYSSMSPERKDYNYYISSIKSRGYNEGEDYEELKNSLAEIDASDYTKRNDLLIGYFNDRMSKETQQAILDTAEAAVSKNKNEEVNEIAASLYDEDGILYHNIRDNNTEDTEKKGFWNKLKDAAALLSQPTREDRASDKGIAAHIADDILNKKIAAEDAAATDYANAQEDLEQDGYIIDSNITDIMKRAEDISPVMQNSKIRNKYLDIPIYNKERPVDGITWENISNEYQGVLNKYIQEGKSKQEAEQLADSYLQRRLQNIAYGRQPLYEQYGNAFIQLGETVLSTALSFAGMGRGLIEAATGNWDYHQGETWFEYLMDAVNNNNWAAAANRLSEYGTFNKEVAEKLENEGGYRYNPIVASWESDNGHLGNLFDSSFLPNVIGQQGFTIALAATSFGMSAAASKGITGASRAARLANISKLRKEIITAEEFATNAAQIAKKYDRINKIANAGIAFISGIPEGHQNGYDTKKRILEDGEEYLDEIKERDLYDSFLTFAANSLHKIENEEQAQAMYDMYKQFYGDSILEANKEKYDDIENQIIVSAIRGATHNTVWTNLLNGSINSTLNLTVQAPKVRNTLRKTKLYKRFGSPDDFNVTRDASGKVKVKADVESGIKKFLNNPWVKAAERPIGEALEEGGQNLGDTMFSSAAYNHIAKYVHDNYGYSDLNSEMFDGSISDFAAAWTGFWKGIQDRETYKAAIYGAAGAILGTPKFGGYRHNGGAKTFKRREGEDVFEYIRRVSPWQSIGAEYSVHKNELEQARKDAQELEEFLNKPENAEIADFMIGMNHIDTNITDSTDSGDGFTLRNDNISRMVRQAALMNRIKNSSIAQDWYAQVDAMASMEKGTELANKSIEDYRKKVDDGQSMSDEDIFNLLRENAQKLKTVTEQTEQALQIADYNFPNALPQAKEAYAYAMVLLQNQEDRSKNLTQEISAIEEGANHNGRVNDKLSDVEKSAIIEFGTPQKAMAQIDALSEEKKRLQAEIKALEDREEKLNKAIEKNPEDSKLRNTQLSLQQEIDSKERKAKQIGIILSQFEGLDRKHFSQISAEDALLSAVDILNLTPAQKAQLFKNYKEGKYKGIKKDIQHRAIEQIINQGIARDPEYIDKVTDLARLEASRESLINGIASITEDIQQMDNFVSNQYLHRALGFYQNEGKSLSRIQDYDEFAMAVSAAFTSGDSIRGNILKSVLDKTNSENWQKYKKSIEYAQQLINYAKQNPQKHEIFGVRFDKQNLETFQAATVYLGNKGVDMSDQNSVRQSLEEKDENGELKFQKFLNEINKGRSRNNRILFDSIESIYNDYLQYIDGYEFSKATEERIMEMPSSQAAEPSKPETNVPTEKPRDKEDIGKEKSLRDKEFYADESRDAALKIWDTVEKSNLPKDLKQLVFDELINIPYNFTKTTIVSKIDKLLKDNISKHKREKKNIGKIRENINKLIQKEDKESKETSEEKDKKEEKKQENKTLQASNIKILGEEQFNLTTVSGKALKEGFFDKYKIKEFLSNHEFAPDTKVVFAVATSLFDTPYFKNAGISTSNVPIMVLIESKGGPVKYNGKEYQPIGLMPQKGNTVSRGANNIGLVRDYIKQRHLDAKTPEFLTDTDDNLITTGIIINTDPSFKPGEPKQLDKFLEDSGVSGTQDGRKEDFIKNVIFKDDRIIYYTQGSGDGITLWRSDPTQTPKSVGSSMFFSEFLEGATPLNIADFNYFTRAFSAVLSDKLSKAEKSNVISLLREEKLGEAASELGKALNGCLYLRNGFKYVFEFNEETNTVDLLLQGENSAALLLQDIPLYPNDGEELPVIDKNATGIVIRQMAEQNAFVWQVSQNRMRKSLDEPLTAEQRKYLGEIYDSGILMSGKVNSAYKEGIDVGVDISDLVNKKKTSNTPKIEEKNSATTVSNPENADTNTKRGNIQTKESVTASEINSPKINTFIEDSKNITRKEDNSGYTDKNTGKTSVRVTSIIRADEEPSNSDTQTVATSLGNVVDRMLKAVFTKRKQGKKVDFEDYKGVQLGKHTKEDFENLITDIENYDNEAWEFLDPGEEEEFKVTGNMTVTMADGNIATIPVSGAMDLVFKNAKGDRLLIVDTKSFNTLTMSAKKKADYVKQLSLYAAFISEKYGIQTDILIAGISLQYKDKPNIVVSINEDGDIISSETNKKVEAVATKAGLLGKKDGISKIAKEDIKLEFSEMSKGMQELITNIIRETNANIPQGEITSVAPAEPDRLGPVRKTTLGGHGEVVDVKDRKGNPTSGTVDMKVRDFIKSFRTDMKFKMIISKDGNIVEKEMTFSELDENTQKKVMKELMQQMKEQPTVEGCKNRLTCLGISF